MCKILTRLKEFIDYKGIPVASFERSVGMSNASFGKQLKKHGAIGTDKLENILSVYPDLSPIWLLTGEGKMLIQEDDSRHDSSASHISHATAKELEDTRPRIPMEAAAGYLSVALNPVAENECERIPMIPTFPKYDFTIVARGDSMVPNVQSGDELACRFIHEPSFIQWGRTYVLDTAQGIVVKKIFDNHDSIMCRSNNTDYPDYTIPKTDIYHLAIVVGLIRHF